MIESDTIKILRECDSGIRMGTSSIDEVMGYAESTKLKKILSESKKRHEELKVEIRELLNEYHDEGREPAAIIKVMSLLKTNMKLVMHESDKTIADLMTDGCNMGIKSLSKYLNQYAAAEERAKDIAKRLIKLEEGLAKDMRDYL